MTRYPDSTKASLEQRLHARARERWPQIVSMQIRRGTFSLRRRDLADATRALPPALCRFHQPVEDPYITPVDVN